MVADEMVALMPQMHNFARSLCRDGVRAADLVQEALLRALSNVERFQPGTNLKAWLFMILRNQFYSDKRRSWRRAPWDEETAETRLVTPASQDASVALSDVVRAMGQLIPEQREALILVGAGGFSYEEAAKICGCALGTVKSRVSRARRALEAMRDGARPPPPGAAPSGEEAMSQIQAQLDRLVRTRDAFERRRSSARDDA